jgi:hypothetical protein
MEIGDSTARGRRWFWVVTLALTLLCLAIRITHLTALPIFGDEAIYLRWAQLIRQDPVRNAFVSVADPKPPLHFWLMAILWPVNADPLMSARLISAVAGALTVPGLLLLCRRLGALVKEREGGGNRAIELFGPIACLLMIFCPFLAFYQRMALADALFVLESVLVAWVSLEFAAALRWGTKKQMVGTTAGLGVLMGLTMLTRQNVSYVLWVLPVVAFCLSGRCAKGEDRDAASPMGERTVTWERTWGRFALGLLVASVLAGAIWCPMLLCKTGPDTKMRILNQPQFTESKTPGERIALAEKNFVNVFVPTYAAGAGAGALPLTGWYWVYLTPGMLVGSVVAMVWMAVRGQCRLAVFLLVWVGILLVPLIVMGSVVYSRYSLSAVVPMLIGLAYMIADIGAVAAMKWGGAVGAIAGGLTLVAALGQGVRDTSVQVADWSHQRMVAQDYYQYINGWTAGFATDAALKYVRQMAAGRPVVVITDDRWGLPADGFWVYLQGQPNVRLYYRDQLSQQPILQAGEHAGRYIVRQDKWLYTPAVQADIASDALVLFVCNDPVHGAKDAGAVDFYKQRNEIAEVVSFSNPVGGGKGAMPEHVVVLFLRH